MSEPLDAARELAERAEDLVRRSLPDDAIIPIALTSIALSLATLDAERAKTQETCACAGRTVQP